ncbi:MAG: endonuclease [Bacteroidales bacterium]|jgi:endonuclease I|nr:endonuclease [Bacteroidales bacterium]
MRRAVVMFLIAWSLLSVTVAQPPAGYYNSASGLTGKALQQALHDIIDNHIIIPYDNLYGCFLTTDVKPGNIVWDMYSDKPGSTPAYVYTYGTGQECGNYNSEADCFNREHSFPKSWFDDASPMYSDLFHLYPTDGYVNNRRSNYPFGETSSPSWTSSNGSMVGPSSWSGYTGIVFEPIDEYKGDFARTYFYMATRYYGEDAGWSGSDMTTGAQPKSWALTMLLAWHRADAVSTKETNRNNEVYKYQNNRNPFIDDPQFVEKIWGTLNDVVETGVASPALNLYPNPAGEYLNIEVRGYDCNGADIFVFDSRGCLVMTEKSDNGIALLDMKELNPGVYFIRISCDREMVTGAFIVD